MPTAPPPSTHMPRKHPQFGALIFEQGYPAKGGIAAVGFGVIMLLVGAVCFGLYGNEPKVMIAGVCALGVGIFCLATGIHYLLVKAAMSFHFYETALLYRERSTVTEVVYAEVAEFTLTRTQSGGQMPGTFFNMQFTTRAGRKIKYQLGVDQGNKARMGRAKELIEHLQASIPQEALSGRGR